MPSRMPRRWSAPALFIATALAVGAPAPAAAEDIVVTASRAEYNAALTAFGVNRAAISGCARDPWSAACPPVSTVVATLSESACVSEVNAEDVYVPTGMPCVASGALAYALTDPAPAAERDHGSGSACGLRVNGPERMYYQGTYDWYMRGRTQNHCLGGQGVTRMEAYVTLQRERLDGEEGWTNLDSDAAQPINGAGQQATPYATWDCNHTRSLLYRVEGLTYATVRGKGYVGVRRATDSRNCPE